VTSRAPCPVVINLGDYNIIFQQPVALVNGLIFRDSFKGATSYCASRMLVRYVVLILRVSSIPWVIGLCVESCYGVERLCCV
jgi:hypothetical protein